MRFVYIIGTNHANQLVGHVAGRHDLFDSFLQLRVLELQPDLIAEEMSEEAAPASTAKMVCRELSLLHLFCDPNSEERAKLGIPSETEIKTQCGFGRALLPHQQETVDAIMRSYWPLREKEWLRRLNEVQFARCLFVLGPDHAHSFRALLAANNYDVKLICGHWEASIIGDRPRFRLNSAPPTPSLEVPHATSSAFGPAGRSFTSDSAWQ